MADSIPCDLSATEVEITEMNVHRIQQYREAEDAADECRPNI